MRTPLLLLTLLAMALVSPTAAIAAQGDTERDLKLIRPNALEVVKEPSKLEGVDRRAIRLMPDRVELVDGAAVVATRRLRGRGTRELADVLAAVDDPAWAEQVDEGTWLLKAAFVQAPRTDLVAAAPRTREIRMADRPVVFMGGWRATARLEGVTVTSWDEETGGPDTNHEDGRPFMLYAGRNGRLDVVGSEIAHLGSDRSTAYGLSYREGGVTGSIVNSELHHNFFAMYSYEAKDIEIRGNRVHDQVVYGIDPHDRTTGLVVEDNEVWGNGSHGIIFSVDVGGVVRDNHSHGNGGNGIVMDQGSDEVVISGNLVEGNEGDGVVLIGSSKTQIRDNVIQGNRVGVRSTGRSLGNVVEANEITGNTSRAVELYGGTSDTLLTGNVIEGQGGDGITIEAPRTRSVGDRISDVDAAFEVRTLATIEDAVVRDAEVGVTVTDRGIVTLSGLDVEASKASVDLDPGAVARMADSRLKAPTPVENAEALRADTENQLITPPGPLPWLAIAGLAFLVAAVVLQVVSRLRSDDRPMPSMKEPQGVWNTR